MSPNLLGNNNKVQELTHDLWFSVTWIAKCIFVSLNGRYGWSIKKKLKVCSKYLMEMKL